MRKDIPPKIRSPLREKEGYPNAERIPFKTLIPKKGMEGPFRNNHLPWGIGRTPE